MHFFVEGPLFGDGVSAYVAWLPVSMVRHEMVVLDYSDESQGVHLSNVVLAAGVFACVAYSLARWAVVSVVDYMTMVLFVVVQLLVVVAVVAVDQQESALCWLDLSTILDDHFYLEWADAHRTLTAVDSHQCCPGFDCAQVGFDSDQYCPDFDCAQVGFDRAQVAFVVAVHHCCRMDSSNFAGHLRHRPAYAH